MNTAKSKTLALITCGLLLTPDSDARIIRVDANSTASGPNGETWAYAYPTLAWALREADPDDEIWVTENGEHQPSDLTDPTEPRSATFLLPRLIKLYGGFRGNEEALEMRDPVLHKSTLSGNIGDPNDDTDDAFHIISASDTEDGVVIDGFIVTRGAADGIGTATEGRGGGIYMEEGNLLILNCVFIYNTSRLSGSALWAKSSKLRIVDTDVRYNHSLGIGGAFYFGSSHVDIRSDIFGPAAYPATKFTGNTAYGAGGAIFAAACPDLTLTYCWFYDNVLLQSTGTGGAVNVYGNPDTPTFFKILGGWMEGNHAGEGGALCIETNQVMATVTGCTFLGNVSTGDGGAIRLEGTSQLALSSGSLDTNRSGGNGGALSIEDAFCNLSRTSFYRNFSNGGGGAVSVKDSENFMSFSGIFGWNHSSGDGGGAFLFQDVLKLDVNYAVLRANYVDNDRWSGGAVLIYDDQNNTDARFEGCRAMDNHAWYGGVVASHGASLDFTACDFYQNTAVPNDGLAFGGGAIWATGTFLWDRDSQFSSNTARGGRGGAISSACHGMNLDHSGFSNNIGYDGGAVYDAPFAPSSSVSRSYFRQCYFRGNEATHRGGAVTLSDRARFLGCVLVDNSARVLGSAIVVSQSEAEILSCVITGNRDANWALVSIPGTSNLGITTPELNLVNSTVAANTSGVAADAGILGIQNSIVMGNTVPGSFAGDIAAGPGVTRNFSYSMLGGSWSGTHLLPTSEVFRDVDNPDGPDGIFATADDGLALRLDSTAVNAGSNPLALSTKDVLGEARVRDGTVDLGAYEMPFKDNDQDGFSNTAELVAGTQTDDLNSHPSLIPVVDLKTQSLVFFPKAGEDYQIEHSQDLKIWQPFGDPIAWADAVIRLPLSNSGAPLPQDFFRVVLASP